MLLMAMMVPFGASAQTMTEENAVLSEWGYILEKNVDFKGGTVNGVDIDPNNQLNVNVRLEGQTCLVGLCLLVHKVCNKRCAAFLGSAAAE